MEKTATRLNVIIAAGGTGGHLFPAQALAKELLEKHPNIQVTFIGAGLNQNPYFDKHLFSFVDIKSGTPLKKNPLKIFLALLKLLSGTLRSLKVFSERKPDVIVGFGSFHSFPAIFAAKLKKVPIVLFESNVHPGKVNRFCSKWAKIAATQFSHTSKYLHSKSICVQMPFVKRKGVTRKEGRYYFGLAEDKHTFLVFGGSQGAEAINHCFCEAVQYLIREEFDFQVIHIVGKDKCREKLSTYYQGKGIKACVKVFEPNMEYAWAAADLSVSRAGAATLSELIEFSVPSLLIPYPFGTENHQEKNAYLVAEKIHGALLIQEQELKKGILASLILSLFENSGEKLKNMRKNLHQYKEKEERKDLSSIILLNR